MEEEKGGRKRMKEDEEREEREGKGEVYAKKDFFMNENILGVLARTTILTLKNHCVREIVPVPRASHILRKLTILHGNKIW